MDECLISCLKGGQIRVSYTAMMLTLILPIEILGLVCHCPQNNLLEYYLELLESTDQVGKKTVTFTLKEYLPV